jgi:TetR/AcrR family transcriptional repressor of mexJK operon
MTAGAATPGGTGGPGAAVPAGADGRSARKRRAIMAAATARFLQDGYHGTSMDQVAADAAVSKQTVYKQFADKEQLFRAIVLRVTGNASAIIAELAATLPEPGVATRDGLRAGLTDLGRRYLDGVLRPPVLALRRLVIAEAERFPDLARTYFEQAPARAIRVLAEAIGGYAAVGLLAAADPELAAAHFAYLTLAIPLDRAQFHPGERLPPEERDRLAAEAVRVFLAAYAG